MNVYKNSYDQELYIVYKTRSGQHICKNIFTKEEKNMTKGGRYSFKTLKLVGKK